MNSKTLGFALALLAALFIGFAWWVYIAAAGKLHWVVPVVVTLAPFVVWAALWTWQRLAARRNASSLEQGLVAGSARDQQRGAPQSPEIARLRSEFERAVTALKGSRLATGGGSGRDALYRLPWYTIIGPPACGKTTVLRNSGLKFPYVPGTGDRLKGVGGTRNCDWWLTNHAILLDTAGRWTLEEEDQDEWLTFLDLLKRNRGDRPLNGVIAAISVAGDEATSLAGVDVDGVKRLAARMRERLDEITGRLGLALPVYLLFTKCDLIPGFVETFSELGPQDRRQIWGFTTSLADGAKRSPRVLFAEQFEILRDSLEQVVLARLSDESNLTALPRIYEFPAQFSALKDKLAVFVDELFEDSLYGETPALRGAYFTSGTQEGAPADLLFDEMSNALLLRPPAAETHTEKKSYFLHDMLVKVVFEDRSLATASKGAVARQRKRRRQITSGLFAGAALIATLPTISCQQNLSSLARTRDLVANVHAGGEASPRVAQPEQTELLLALGADVQRHADGPSSPLARFGLYQGDALKEPLADLYAVALKEWVVRPLQNQNNTKLINMTQQLEAMRQRSARSVLDERSRTELRKALELHLLLTTPRDACGPKPGTRKEWLAARLGEVWKKVDPPLDTQASAARKATLDAYVDLLDQRGDALLFGRDVRSVAIARPALTSDNKVERSLRELLEQRAEDQRTLSQLTGASTIYQSSATLHGAFTRDAWLEAASDLNSPEKFRTGDERWVLGCEASNSDELRSARQSQAFQQEYLRQFQESWQRFLPTIVARSPSNAAEAETMLVELVSRPGVLGKLFLAVKENTDLPAPPSPVEDALIDVAASAINNVAAKKGKEGVLPQRAAPVPPELLKLKRAFAELANFGVGATPDQEAPLEQYRRQLESVLAALKAYRADEAKIHELAVATRAAQDSVDMLLRNSTGSWGALLRELLLPPLAGIANIALQDRGRQLEHQWCELVYRPFQEELAGRYPLQTDSKQPASLQAFQRFFQPATGSLWVFVESQLRGYVAQAGGRFRFEGALAADAKTLLREDLLHFLGRAYQLRRAFFPGDAPTVRMPFRIRVRGAPGYSVTSFRTGSTNVRYDSSGEVWIAAEWPGDQPSLGASLSVTSYQGAGPRPLTKEGEWGLFSLLDEREGARVLERSNRQITVGWKPKGDLHWIKVDFATDDSNSPLMSVPLGGPSPNLLPLSVPTRIANGGDGC